MTPRARLLLAIPLILLAACSSAGEASSPSSSAAASDRGGVPAGYPMDVDVVAPLIITTVAPDPIPVPGTDGKVHVVYELEVVNFSPRLATITSIETLASGPDGPVVSTVEGGDVTARSLLLAGFGAPTAAGSVDALRAVALTLGVLLLEDATARE